MITPDVSGMSTSGPGLVVFLSALLCVSAQTHDGTFRYELVKRLLGESCHVCLGDDCWQSSGARCQFYAESAAALGTEPAAAGVVPSSVDVLVHDMMQEGATSWSSQECIPYVSQYTDCDKDNICLGCKLCSCDVVGKWICQHTQRCRADAELNVDHRILVLVIAALKSNSDLTSKLIKKEINAIIDDSHLKMKREVLRNEGNKDFNNDIIQFDDIINAKIKSYKGEVFDLGKNDKIPFDTINIMKRDISAQKINLTTVSPNRKEDNFTKSIGLINNILNPLAKIIDDKEQELGDLLIIKQNLIEFIKSSNDTIGLNTTNRRILNDTNSVLTVYSTNIHPEIQYNLRKINPNIVDKLLYKLKRDIYEVIKDIVGLKKVTITNDLPDNLKALVRAMGNYVRKQNNKSDSGGKGFSRNVLENETSDALNTTKDYLIKILTLIDKDKQNFDALSALSKTTHKIVKRVIKNNYKNDFSAIGLKVYEPEYNLINDLKNVGNKWRFLTASIKASKHAENLYAMKLLHLSLSADILKLTDAYALIDIAHSRRMIPIDGTTGGKLLNEIMKNLHIISDEIKLIISEIGGPKDNADKSINEIKKKSILSKFKTLFKASKKAISKLVHQKTPRREITQGIAKKRLDELSHKQYNNDLDTLIKWQPRYNVISRQRRSMIIKKSRMSNIIPKYLRGKVPALIAKKKEHRHNKVYKKQVSRSNQVAGKATKKNIWKDKTTTEAIIYHLNRVEVIKPQIKFVHV